MNCILSAPVAAAKAAGRPLVALESTVLTHGLPAPLNRQVAQAMEAAVAAAGAVPATVAVLDGALQVGLEDHQLERLCAVTDAIKVNRATLAATLARGRSGGTTVSATMLAAAAAGIEIFATGGIGGVHRGWTSRPDISADLAELARTPVTVVCAGPKAILDVGATVEVLEALGIPVLGWRCDRLPAFWLPATPEPVGVRIDHAAEAAAIIRRQRALGLGGVLVVQPVPATHALDPAMVARVVDQAEQAAAARGIRGAALTPFLLQAVAQASGGATLAANQALLLANARLAGELAVALAAPVGATG